MQVVEVCGVYVVSHSFTFSLKQTFLCLLDIIVIFSGHIEGVGVTVGGGGGGGGCWWW